MFIMNSSTSTMINMTNVTSTSAPYRTKAPGTITEADELSDAIWILTSSFIIVTMQSGFGLVEAGMVSRKNETNIMVKNAIDVIMGGLAYWMFGFAFSFGQGPLSNGFTGVGLFFTDASEAEMGYVFAKYFFQLSFATTATTIVSGAMAERTNLKAYMLYSFVNTLSYCFPAHWIWDEKGWLARMGCIDIAGCSAVHMVGGMSAFVAAVMLKPRYGRFDSPGDTVYMASPTNVILGTFMLWWGWLGFNCGSTFGISGGKWKLASRAAVVTMNGSVGGGIFSVLYCYVLRKKRFDGKLDVATFSAGILSGLVGITAICAITKPWEALIIGFIGGAAGLLGIELMEKAKIDDPVGCIGVHWLSGVWGMIAVAFFAEHDRLEGFSNQFGVFKGGALKILGVQLAAVVTITMWAVVSTFVQLYVIDKLVGLRMSLKDELLGADYVEHGIEDGLSEEPGNHAYGKHVQPSNAGSNNLARSLAIHEERMVQNSSKGIDNPDIHERIKQEENGTEPKTIAFLPIPGSISN